MGYPQVNCCPVSDLATATGRFRGLIRLLRSAPVKYLVHAIVQCQPTDFSIFLSWSPRVGLLAGTFSPSFARGLGRLAVSGTQHRADAAGGVAEDDALGLDDSC